MVYLKMNISKAILLELENIVLYKIVKRGLFIDG
jgi:hypothetical protein